MRAPSLALEVKLLLSEVGTAEGVGERQKESDAMNDTRQQ